MFTRLRRAKRRQTLVLWLLILVFALPLLVFFHVGISTPGGGEASFAGTLFGRRIPMEDFWFEHQQQRRTWEEQLGQVPEALEPWLRQQTWDRLILQAYARR